MVCSEKELGISEEHEGIIFLDDDAPTGMPLADYMGDAVFEISILPNMIRNACVLGVAREMAAATGKPLRKPACNYPPTARPSQGKPPFKITDPELNPRFVLGLIRNVEPPQPLLGAAPPAPGRHAPDQQHCGRHQLRHARDRPAAARLRL